jgi:hypothetical protein
MAGLYDTILRGDPVSVTQAQAKARLAEEARLAQSQFMQSLQGASAPVRQGAITGAAAANLGKAIYGHYTGAPNPVDTSPEVTAVKQGQALLKDIQGIAEKVDPSSSDFATQAAAKAKVAGRDDLALQFLSEAATRRKQESLLAKKTEQTALENQRATLNTLPGTQKYSWIANNKDEAGKLYGLKGKELDSFIKDAKTNLQTEQAKNVADLQKLSVVNPVNTTKADEAQIGTSLEARGWNQDAFDTAWFGTDGSKEQALFKNKLAEYVATEQSLLSKQGVNETKDTLVGNLLSDLESQGALVKGSVFDANKIGDIMSQRLNELRSNKPAPPSVQAPSAPSTQVQGAPKVFDFSQPQP